ncbi:MAG: TonB-dependent receptor [Burkholderiaceae bacterium]|nr:TonB-dependent receptor [Burkholderiaceae bacterium]
MSSRLPVRAEACPPAARSLVGAACLALVCAASAQTQPTADLPTADTQTVVITATRHAMLALDAPAAMSVVTRQEIEARGADDVLDAVRGETGVSLQGRSIGGRKVISLRGMDPKHTLFLVDGRRVVPSDGMVGHSDFQVDWIPVDDIERIEIVRGPLSVLYGSEALGGVVHVITRQAGEQWRVTARAEGSVASGDRGGDGHRAAVSVSGPLAPGLGLRAGLATSRREAVASPDDAQISELEGHDKTDGWLGLAWQASPAHRVALDLNAGEETRTADSRERSGARRYHVSDNLLQRAMASLAWDAEWGTRGDTRTQLRAYGTRLDVENRRTAGVAINPPQTLRDRVLEGLLRHDAGPHALTAGFELRNETLEDPGMPDGRSLARHRAVFVQDEWHVIGGEQPLDLTLGLRHDRHHLFGDESSPRLYASWRAAPGWTLKGGLSHGFKAPNLKQIVPGGRREGPNTVLGNPDLKPETSDSAEVGLAYARQGLELQAMLFSQRVQNLIELTLVTPGAVPGVGTYVYENVSRARLRGLEMGAAMPLGAGFSTQVNATWLDATDADGDRLTYRPRLNLGARLDWTQGPWQAGLRADHSRGTLLPSTTRGAADVAVPSLTLLGAHVQRSIGPGLTLALRVHNLGNQRPADASALYTHAEAPRTVSVSLSGVW